MTAMSRCYAEVALNLPLDRLFTYAVPEPLRPRMSPGMRVLVPFGSREIGGTCVRVVPEDPGFPCKPVTGLVEESPLFSAAMLRLAGWIARRYGSSMGEALDAALPFAVRSGGRRRRVLVAALAIPEAGVEKAVEELEERFAKQARALRILADAGEDLEVRELCRRAKVGESPVRTLAKKGIVRLSRQEQERDPLFALKVEREPGKPLIPAQQRAVDAIVASIEARRSDAYLLFGVTGSGKTEVYLRALEETVRSGRQAIVLVPEIALTPQTVARFRSRFDRVAVLHSHLTDVERQEQWRAIQRGEADVVIGARSAIFAPVPRLGIVVVDEAHESTFKQQNVPRYDAREAARARARFERAVLVLGSATPSLESFHRSRNGRLRRLDLPERVAGGTFPETIVADLTQTVPVPGKARFLTDRLRVAVVQAVARREQVILFLNRRGYATAAICKACGGAIECENCSIVLVYHRRIRRIVCHYCGFERRLPDRCASCEGSFRLGGFGTERIEEEIAHAVPEARVARMDSDTMKKRGAHEEVLSAFRAGRIDVLVGTQMIAKGLDFPNVTLVGIVSADQSLNLPDYRAAERTFGLVAQVAGRAGRSEKGGVVIVQTREPDHFAIRLALRHDYERFAEIEMQTRMRDGYPPFGHLARIVVQGPEEAEAGRIAQELRDQLGEWIVDDDTALLGPAPCPIAMINGQARFHIVCKALRRSGIRRFVQVVRGRPRPKGKLRLLLDVDPISML
ncbi:MAG: primosomal protein N' [Planctomycetota bacterium JB042]